MFTKSKGHRRVTSLFYAMAITLGIYISVNELHFFQNTYNFIVFSVATFFIYIVELFTSFQNKSRKIQINFDYNDEVNELSEVFHKILLPIFLYLSILGFSYFNIGVFAISFLINYLMLIRIKMLTNKFVIQSTLNSAIISLVFLALNLGSKFNALQIALILIFLFYISTAIIHHTIRKTLTREVFLEYMVVTTLLLVIAFLGM